MGETQASARRIRAQLLDASHIIASQPSNSPSPSVHQSSPTFDNHSASSSSFSSSSSSSSSGPPFENNLNFSCKSGSLIAVLAPPSDSLGYGFWLAECKENVVKPKTEVEGKSMEVEVFYFANSEIGAESPYTKFHLESGRRGKASSQCTYYVCLLGRVLSAKWER